MRSMNIPGFSGAASIYPQSGTYRAQQVNDAGDGKRTVVPQIRAGGLGGVGGLGGGRLNAWGCWDSCCGSHCAAGHYEAGPVGWQWVCDWWVCDDPCQRCIWPW